MTNTFRQYTALLGKKGGLQEKIADHLKVIDAYYADDIIQIENSGLPIQGKQVLRKMEIKNLSGVNSVSTAFKNVVFDHSSGIVWGEMVIEFDSKQSGKKKLEEAFMQRWEGDKIIFQRFYYDSILEAET